MSPANRRTIVDVSLIAGAAGFLLWDLHAAPTLPSTRNWPVAILTLILLAAACVITSTLLVRRRERLDVETGTDVGANPAVAPISRVDAPGRSFAMMVAFATYTLSLSYLGFALSTAIFMAVGVWLLNGARRVLPFSWAVGAAVAIYVVFVVLFEVPMPSGILAGLF